MANSARTKLVLFIGRLRSDQKRGAINCRFGKAKIPSAHLVLVGPSEKRLRGSVTCSRRAGMCHAKNSFCRTTLRRGSKAALATADLFVLPSLSESFGNAAGEAVAANVPVLLTNTCGIAPIINARAGLAVPLGVDSLADGLTRMLNQEIRHQMTARREEVKRELSWMNRSRYRSRSTAILSRGGKCKVESRSENCDGGELLRELIIWRIRCTLRP
jgi:glycosyltransferase involved in cell wall biosynthesis